MFIIFFLPLSLKAEPGDWDLELKIGTAAFRNHIDLNDYGSFFFFKHSPTEALGTLARNSGSESVILQSVAVANSAPEPRFYSRQINAQFHYNISTKHSIGLALIRNDIGARNVGYSKTWYSAGYLFNRTAGNPLNLLPQQEMQLEILFPLYRETLPSFLKLDTGNLSYTFNFFTSGAWRPYLTLQVGAGRDRSFGYLIYRAAFQLGAKYFFTPNFYMSAETGYDNYSGLDSSDYLWTVDHYSFNIGTGVRL